MTVIAAINSVVSKISNVVEIRRVPYSVINVENGLNG